MGFSLQQFEDIAEKKYHGIDIDDAPGGPVTLRSALRLSKEARAEVKRLNDEITALQEDENADEDELHRLMVDLLAATATRPDSVREYLGDKDLALLMAVFSAYGEATQDAAGK